MKATLKARLVRFLQEELAIPQASIAVALRHEEQAPNLLPIILWQYGLVTLEQLDQIFDWLEKAWSPELPTPGS
ncbi:DUF2949 domain-containing protein [Oculatella sp. LEGE 06141]|uniref:DUF2949 domain-containing protein n=1 Tax=Oculatella sp. LEGE 06141 TaxID=1828648 RepID=UPI00187F92CE|nr:DUF2949 domain-containing protein [Oculatella sp. LEGE 06141]MBE9180572.1 DUF2949 domain-containing protein [Oculatella sp. LEGE 06141]